MTCFGVVSYIRKNLKRRDSDQAEITKTSANKSQIQVTRRPKNYPVMSRCASVQHPTDGTTVMIYFRVLLNRGHYCSDLFS